MARRAKDISVTLKVEYIPLPEERRSAWCAAVVLLLNTLREGGKIFEKEDLILGPGVGNDSQSSSPAGDED